MSHVARVFAAATLAALAASSVACGSSEDPFGPDPDLDAVQARFVTPDGSFVRTDARALFVRYAEQVRAQESVDVGGSTTTSATSTGVSSAAARSQALRLLDLAVTGSPTASCSALEHGDATGSCACASGGSFRYDFAEARALKSTTGPVDLTLRLGFGACAQDASTVIDGTEHVRLHVAHVEGGKVDEQGLGVLTVLDVSVRSGGATHTLDLAASMRDGNVELAMKVEDGFVAVRGSGADGKNGSFVVRDRSGTWTCVAKDGTGACTTDRGETRSF